MVHRTGEADSVVEGLAPDSQAPRNSLESATLALLRALGEDPDREGLRDTPARVARAWQELGAGYGEDPGSILGRVFQVPVADEMVVLAGIDFYSTCEHHLLPFYGVAAVGYIPMNGRVVGISKLARLVNCFARRLQIQERMTGEIAMAVNEHLKPRGVGVLVRGKHLCMGCRGVRIASATMMTQALVGLMRDDAAARAEFIKLAT